MQDSGYKQGFYECVYHKFYAGLVKSIFSNCSIFQNDLGFCGPHKQAHQHRAEVHVQNRKSMYDLESHLLLDFKAGFWCVNIAKLAIFRFRYANQCVLKTGYAINVQYMSQTVYLSMLCNM